MFLFLTQLLKPHRRQPVGSRSLKKGGGFDPKGKGKHGDGKGKGKGKGKKKVEVEKDEEDIKPVATTQEGAAASTITRVGDLASEEKDLYGSALAESVTAMVLSSMHTIKTFSARVVDTVDVMGPVLHAEYCHVDDSFDGSGALLDWGRVGAPRQKIPVGSASAFVAEREVKAGLQLSTGLGENGSVTRVAQGRRYAKVATKTIPQVNDIFSSELKLQPRPYSLLVLSFGDGSAEMKNHSKILAVYEGRKHDVQRGENETKDVLLQEVTGSGAEQFITDDNTVGLGELAAGVVVQTCKRGLRIVRLDGEAKMERATKGTKAKGKAMPISDSTEAKVDIAEASSAWKIIQDLRLEGDVNTGGLGLSADDFVTSVDVVPADESDHAHISLVTNEGSMFILRYSERLCQTEVLYAQRGHLEVPETGMDVDMDEISEGGEGGEGGGGGGRGRKREAGGEEEGKGWRGKHYHPHHHHHRCRHNRRQDSVCTGVALPPPG